MSRAGNGTQYLRVTSHTLQANWSKKNPNHVYTCINFASGTELVAYFNFSEEISEKLKYVCVCASP